MIIRELDVGKELPALRACVVELQDFERTLDPRMPPGAEIADEYLDDMLQRCRECNGRVLVAHVDGKFAGFVTVLAKVRSEDIDDGDLEYGLVSDLVVAADFRKQGVGRRLLEAAEAFAREAGVRWLRVSVLAANRPANELYASLGFEPLYVEREKTLD